MTRRVPQSGLRRLLGSADFVRLWTVGGVVNALRWLEILAAGLFTFELTGSALAVALVSAARALPLLLFGAIAGVVCEAIDRKRILFVGLLVYGGCAGFVCALALAGLARPVHVALAAFVTGLVWATEMATRRRMVAEVAGPELVPRAVALDSLTGAVTRMAGPLIGSASFAAFGLHGAYAISTLGFFAAAALVPAINHIQETRPLALARVGRDMAEAIAFARRTPDILAVMLTTTIMNMLAFAYVAVVAPIAVRVFAVEPAWTGLIASAEPLGSMVGGLVLASVTPRAQARTQMLGGSVLFLAGLLLMTAMPSYGAACAMLSLGGLGLALFGNTQTTLIVTSAPAAMRSRLMGLITVGIGTAPLGQILIGALSDRLGPVGAVRVTGGVAMVLVMLLGVWWMRLPKEE